MGMSMNDLFLLPIFSPVGTNGLSLAVARNLRPFVFETLTIEAAGRVPISALRVPGLALFLV